MNILFKLKFKLLALAIISQSYFAIHSQNLEFKIDSLLQTTFKFKGPGASFLVTKNGQTIYRKAFGQANLELEVPMKPESVFKIGSMTKQFTAIAILMLEEEGKLNLDDEITKFIPDYPTQGKTITVHHLLTHTSGIKSFTRMKGLNKISRTDFTPTELINFFKNEPMDFNPGEKYKYNNSGYLILGHIIEVLSGKSYADFIENNIFKKIGMTASYYGSHKKIIKGRASGYHNRKGYLNTRYISLTIPYAAGSIMSNTDDMLKWQQALENNTLITQETAKKAFTSYTLNNGDKINYGYGWHIRKLKNKTSIEHGGSIFGFKSMGVYIPEENIYVIGLSNCDCNSPTQIAKDIAALAISNSI